MSWRTENPTIVACALALTVALVSPPTLAAGPEEVEEETTSELAVREFDAGNFDTAIELFEQAYAEDPQPNYLFNIGRVYEEKADFRSAVTYYQRFINEGGVDLEARKAALTRLEVLRQAIAVEEAEAEDDDEPEEVGDSPTPPRPVVEPDVGERPALDTTRGDRIRQVRIGGYTLMGAGAASLVVGAVFGGLAIDKTSEADEAFVDQMQPLRDEARTRADVSTGTLISGGILAGAGLIMVLATLGKKNRAAARAAAGRGGFGLRGSF